MTITDPLPAALPSGVHVLHSRRSTREVRRELEAAGWAVAVVDVGDGTDKSAVLASFAGALGFPEWVGRNWDALEDALRDLSWWPAGVAGRAIIVRGDPASTGPLGAILVAVAAWWAEHGDAFVVLARS